MINRKKINAGSFGLIFVFFVISTLFLFLFSWSTSSMYDYWKDDPAVFLLTGYLTNHRMIPYQDFFDHKGPVMVLIQFLGYYFGNGKAGVFIIQIISLTATLCGIYKILRLFYKKTYGILLTIISLFILNIFFQGGNFTEEYCLPFLTWSIYFAAKYFLRSETGAEHNPLYTFFYGITFMVCAFTRITNAIPICGIIFVGFIVLLKNKKYVNVLKNVGTFILGAGVVLLPIMIYFIRNGALYDMIYATFLYNFHYTANNGAGGASLPLIENIKKIIYVFPVFTLLVITLYDFKLNAKEVSLRLGIILSSIVGIIFFLSGMPYRHYLMVWIPVMALTLGLLKTRGVHKKFLTYGLLGAVIISAGIVLVKNVGVLYDSYGVYRDSSDSVYAKESRDILKSVSVEDRNAIIGYNVRAYFYLAADVQPCYKYCVLQDFQSGKDKQMEDEQKKDFASGKAKYIVINKNGKNKYDDIIFERYHEADRTQTFILLERN